VSYGDFVAAGSLAAAREKGVVSCLYHFAPCKPCFILYSCIWFYHL